MCPSSGNHAVAAVLIMHVVKQLVYFVMFYAFMNYSEQCPNHFDVCK